MINPNLITVKPIRLPLYPIWPLGFLNGLFARAAVWKAMEELGVERIDVLWVFSPFHAFAVRSFELPVVVYDCADYSEAFVKSRIFPHQVLRRHVVSLEKYVLTRANLTFVTAHALGIRCARYCQNVHLLSNGVDESFFINQEGAPREALRFERPIIGYIGRISEHFDFELVGCLARERPKWSFVMVGSWSRSVEKKVRNLETLANMHFLGMKRYELMRPYIQQFDVAIIPFLLNDLTQNLWPIKLFEYLACGKPVVSTNVLEKSDLLEMVRISDKHSFLNMIEESLRGNSVELENKRIAKAKEYTWGSQIHNAEMLLSEVSRMKRAVT
jgi:glycosyltransferase involved in cell wall biosynthesis